MDFEEIFREVLSNQLVEKGIKVITSAVQVQLQSLKRQVKSKTKKPADYDEIEHLFQVTVSEQKVYQHIKNNMTAANNWSNEINFTTTLLPKNLDDLFINIDLYVSQLKNRYDIVERLEKIPYHQVVDEFERNKIIFGGAGAGKTTLVKKLYREYIEKNKEYDFGFPFVIRFRELDYDYYLAQKSPNLFWILLDLLGINIVFPDKHYEKFSPEYYETVKNLILTFFNRSKVLFIADGFDEIPDLKLKKQIESDLKALSLGSEGCKFILTSRTNDYLKSMTNAESYEICYLDENQIKELVGNWLNDPIEAAEVFEKIKNSPYFDQAIRPLLLVHLVAIYIRLKRLPPKPTDVYDFNLTLLLNKWDQDRDFEKERPSAYAEFFIEKKKKFLSHLAYELTHTLKRTVFTSDDILACYNRIHRKHNLPADQAISVVNEIESHTGVFFQATYNSFQFSHKSLQEFLTAKYLLSLMVLPEPAILNTLPNELAILIAESNDSNRIFRIFYATYNNYSEQFWNDFLVRLVEEKPDFDATPATIVFFLRAMHEYEGAFKSTFFSLLKKTNLSIGFDSFNELYRLGQEYEYYVYLELRDPNKFLDDRYFYAKQIQLAKSVYTNLKPFLESVDD